MILLALSATALIALRQVLRGRAAAVLLMAGWTLWWAEVGVRSLLGASIAPTNSDHSRNAWSVTDHGIPELSRLPIPTAVLALDGRRPERQPDTWRVLFLGDSFTAGEGVGPGEDTPSRVAERLVGDSLALQPEILNHGISGLSAWDEAALWADHSRWWQPDVIVWMYVLNDLGTTNADPELRRQGWAGPYDDAIVDRTRDAHTPHPSALVDYVQLQLRSRSTTALVEAAYRDGHNPALAGDALAALTATLAEVGDVQRQRGGRVLFVVWPLLHRLRDYPFRDAHAAVLTAAAAAGVETLDLLPTFEGYEASALWASPQDHHPNAQGYAMAAEAVHKALVSRPATQALPERCPTASGDSRAALHDALCRSPHDGVLHLRMARYRLQTARGDYRAPFSPRPLTAVSLHQAVALAPAGPLGAPLRADVATVAAELLAASDL